MSAGLKIAGVILAAGESRRMGRLKQLLPLGDRTILERVVESFLPAVERLYVVLGHEAARVQAAIANIPVQILLNPDYREGMICSVQCAVRAMPPEVAGMLLGLVDQPLIHQSTVQYVVDAYAGQGIVIPSYSGRRGHPVLISRTYFPEILQLTGAEGGLRALMRRHAAEIRTLPVDDPTILRDLDTPEDYQAALKTYQER